MSKLTLVDPDTLATLLDAARERHKQLQALFSHLPPPASSESIRQREARLRVPALQKAIELAAAALDDQMLLGEVRQLLDKIHTWDGDDERRRQRMVAALNELIGDPIPLT